MEVIYKLELTINNLIRGVQDPNRDVNIVPTKLINGLNDTQTTATQTQEHTIEDKPKILSVSTHTQQAADCLIIGDSVVRRTESIMQQKGGLNIKSHIIPGGQIKDLSRYISRTEKLPQKVIINIGFNNVNAVKTPNHLMRPLWLTIYAAQKREKNGEKFFKNTKWYVNSILHRRDAREKHVQEHNEALSFMCDQLGLTFINTIQDFTEDCYSHDGIHPNQRGAELLADLMTSAAGLKEAEDMETDPDGPGTTDDLGNLDTGIHETGQTLDHTTNI